MQLHDKEVYEARIGGIMGFDYEGLLKDDYGLLDTQIELVKIYLENDCDVHRTSEARGTATTNVYKSLKNIRHRASRYGYNSDPQLNHKTPDGFIVKGTSTLYKDGEAVLQWQKTSLEDQAYHEAMREAIEDITKIADGKAKPRKAPAIVNGDIMAVYPIGDAHIGLYSWAAEAGDDFNLDIAKDDLVGAMKRLVDSSPNAKEALIVDVGDFYHADNQSNETTHSKNKLDVDTRWAKVLQVGLLAFVELIYLALEKHDTVKVINAIGNHNEHSAIYLSTFLAAWFRNEPRVKIDESPAMFRYHQFGKTLLGITHGHTAKAPDLGEIMAADCEDIWSETKYRHWLTGHIHHDSVKEFRTCKVESFRTLAAKDAWHSASGYRSGRDMKCIVFHKEFGEIQRHVVNVAMLRTS